MTAILRPWIPEKVRVFLDDIVVLGPRGMLPEAANESDVRDEVRAHLETVAEVLDTLRRAGLAVSGKKCHIAVRRATVLGFECLPEGRKPPDDHAAAIERLPTPQNTREVRSFIAACNYYRAWVPEFAQKVAPLYELTKKWARFSWAYEEEKAFNLIKRTISSAPVLRSPIYGDPDRPLILTVDASPTGVGAVLQQEYDGARSGVIRYESFRLDETQQRYPQIKRELFGLKESVLKLKRYLYGQHFIVETDAQPLIGMLNQPDLPGDICAAWIAKLLQFDFTICHIPGKTNVVADALSRLPDGSEAVSALVTVEPGLDPEFEALVAAVAAPPPVNPVSIGEFAGIFEFLGFDSVLQATVQDGLDHVELGPAVHVITHAELPRGQNAEEAKELARSLFASEGLLYLHRHHAAPARVILDSAEQRKILAAVHGATPIGHRGVATTRRILEAQFYWPGMSCDVEQFIRKCDICQHFDPRMNRAPLRPFLGGGLFEHINVDLVELPQAADGSRYIAVAREDLTGWVEARALLCKLSSYVYAFVYEEVFSQFGIPQQLVVDRGELWTNVVQEAERVDGIIVSFTTPYHLQTNGAVERANQTLIRVMSKVAFEYLLHWPMFLPAIRWADRISVKRTMGFSPYQLLYGAECPLPLDQHHGTWRVYPWSKVCSTDELLLLRAYQLMWSSWIRENAGVALDQSRLYMRDRYDVRASSGATDHQVGALVLRYDSRRLLGRDGKLAPRWTGPFRVTRVVAPNVYKLAELDGTDLRGSYSGNNLRRYVQQGSRTTRMRFSQVGAVVVSWTTPE